VVANRSGYSPFSVAIEVSVVTGKKPRPRIAKSVELEVVNKAPGWSIKRVDVTRTPPAEYVPVPLEITIEWNSVSALL
jgi:hypothetical protein